MRVLGDDGVRGRFAWMLGDSGDSGVVKLWGMGREEDGDPGGGW